MFASRGAPIPQTGAAGFDRNQWQLSIGISGNLRPESVAGFDRNQWQPSTGIRKDEHRQIRLGYAPIPSDRYQYRTFSAVKAVKDEYLAWGRAQGGRDGRPWGATHLRNRASQLTWW